MTQKSKVNSKTERCTTQRVSCELHWRKYTVSYDMTTHNSDVELYYTEQLLYYCENGRVDLMGLKSNP